MEKKEPLIGISTIVVVLLILGSLSNVVGYKMVQSSNQKIKKSYIDQKELLFQTIIDLVNNKEIQKIISMSEIRRGGFFNKGVSYSVFPHHVLTKKFLNTAYQIGLILSKTISKSKIHSLLERYQVSHREAQKEITAVIEKNDKLNKEIKQLPLSNCDCENKLEFTSWPFPIVCSILFVFLVFDLFIYIFISDYSKLLSELSSVFLLILLTLIIDIFHCYPISLPH